MTLVTCPRLPNSPSVRWLAVTRLSREIAELDAHLDRLVAQAGPELVSLAGIGADHAATLLIVAGDNP